MSPGSTAAVVTAATGIWIAFTGALWSAIQGAGDTCSALAKLHNHGDSCESYAAVAAAEARSSCGPSALAAFAAGGAVLLLVVFSFWLARLSAPAAVEPPPLQCEVCLQRSDELVSTGPAVIGTQVVVADTRRGALSHRSVRPESLVDSTWRSW